MDQETPFPKLGPSDGSRVNCLMAFTGLDPVPNGEGALGQRAVSAPRSGKAGWTSKPTSPPTGPESCPLQPKSQMWNISQTLETSVHRFTHSFTHAAPTVYPIPGPGNTEMNGANPVFEKLRV